MLVLIYIAGYVGLNIYSWVKMVLIYIAGYVGLNIYSWVKMVLIYIAGYVGLNIYSWVKMVLIYIAGYVGRKDDRGDDFSDTTFYLENFGKYTEELNRGGLTLPADEICQWVLYTLTLCSTKLFVWFAELLCLIY